MKMPWSKRSARTVTSQSQSSAQRVTLLAIPIRDGELVVEITEPRSPMFDDPTFEQVRRATLRIDCGIFQVVEPNLYIVDGDLDELTGCLQDLEEERETTWLATSGRSPYLHFRPVPDDPDEWEVIFRDAPGTGAELRASTTLDWVSQGRLHLDALRASEARQSSPTQSS